MFCKDFSSLGAVLLCAGSQLLPWWWARCHHSTYITSPLSPADKMSSWALWWGCDRANCPWLGQSQSPSVRMLPGSMPLGSNSGLTGPMFCIWNLSPYGFGSVQILSWECLLSVPNLLSESVNICLLHQYSSVSSLYLPFLLTFAPF